jgi:hypothetical protein
MRFVVFFLQFFLIFTLYSETIIAKKVAKIDSEIILYRDVEKYSKLYDISVEQAKADMINDAILYCGAKMNSTAPTDEEVDKQVASDKKYFASKLGVKLSDVSDQDFLSALQTNNASMKTYKEYVKRNLWIDKYLKDTVSKEKEKDLQPTEKQMNDLIAKHPEMFEEKEGVLLSMIFFSYYDGDGKKKPDDAIKSLTAKSNSCMQELKEGADFEKCVEKYSEDLISSGRTPKGRIGIIYFDDKRVDANFTSEIISYLKTSKEGLINKVFTTKDGLFILKIDERIKAKKYSKEESILKAQSVLKKESENDKINKSRLKLIEDLKKIVDIVVY